MTPDPQHPPSCDPPVPHSTTSTLVPPIPGEPGCAGDSSAGCAHSAPLSPGTEPFLIPAGTGSSLSPSPGDAKPRHRGPRCHQPPALARSPLPVPGPRPVPRSSPRAAAPAVCSGAEGRRRACLAARSLPSHPAGGAARPPSPCAPPRHTPRPPLPGLGARQPGVGGPRKRPGPSLGTGGFPRAGCRADGKTEPSSSFFIQQRGEPRAVRWGGHLGAWWVSGDPSVTLL